MSHRRAFNLKKPWVEGTKRTKANGTEVEGRGVSSDTLKANMRALFGGVNLLYKK